MLFNKTAFITSFLLCIISISAGFSNRNMRNALKPAIATADETDDVIMNWSTKYVFSSHSNDSILRLRVFSSCSMTIPIGIGTPVQWFNLSLDFLTPDTILPMKEMEYSPESKSDPQIYRRKLFKPEASSTYLNYSRSFSHFIYGDGYLAADVGYNHKTFRRHHHYLTYRGNLMLIPNKMDFMMITKVGYIFGLGMLDVPADGVLGLAPMEEAEYGRKSFISWLLAKWGSTYSKITFFFNNFNPDDPDEMKQNSFVFVDFGPPSFNSPFPTMCVGDEWFHAPLVILDKWSLVAKKIYAIFDGPNSSQKGAGASTATADVVFGENQNVTIMPTEFFIRIPKAQMLVMKELLHASDDVWPGRYQLPCNSTKLAPKIKFDFETQKTTGGSQKLSIEFAPHEYILPSQFGDCELIFTHASMDKITFYELGYSFFQKHCLQLFYSSPSKASMNTTSSVGFAPKKK